MIPTTLVFDNGVELDIADISIVGGLYEISSAQGQKYDITLKNGNVLAILEEKSKDELSLHRQKCIEAWHKHLKFTRGYK